MTDRGGGGDPRALLAEHLRFLREIGLREIRVGAPPPPREAVAPGAGRAAPAPAGTAPPPEAGLFDAPPITPRGGTSRDATRAGAALAILRDREIGDCRRCRLSGSRTNIVFGVGAAAARLMFVGEGPGRDEDQKGEPFVGRAGQLLTDIIKAMGFSRDQVYIANVVKCRPPENRTPEPDEIEACRGFLEAQIEIIAPEVIVCLGAVAAGALLGTTAGISKIRGVFREYRGIPVMPTFHPAYLLRSPDKKRDVWQDMKLVMARLSAR